VSLTGGIPGIISTYESMIKKPKLNVKIRNYISGDIQIDSSKKSFLLILISIGNSGTSDFKRFVDPIAEIQINNEWISLESVGMVNPFLEKICS
jgi:hypothetical protein